MCDIKVTHVKFKSETAETFLRFVLLIYNVWPNSETAKTFLQFVLLIYSVWPNSETAKTFLLFALATKRQLNAV
jgi:hypothetical protein